MITSKMLTCQGRCEIDMVRQHYETMSASHFLPRKKKGINFSTVKIEELKQPRDI